jgi:hypothetical protein
MFKNFSYKWNKSYHTYLQTYSILYNLNKKLQWVDIYPIPSLYF